MCVIISNPTGKELDLKILKNAVERNPDGWGMTVLDGDNIIVHHGFGFKPARRAWIKYGGLPRVFHARVRTCGKADLANTHPFDASRNGEPRFIFHNGQLSIPRFNEDFSDSWHFAEYLKAFETNDELLKNLDKYATQQNSRFTFVTPGKIHISGHGWLHRDDISYSNVSALANIVQEGDRWKGAQKEPNMVYKGGLLTDTSVEVTCDKAYNGLNWDAERKLYSNKAPAAPVRALNKSNYSPRTFIDHYGQTRYLRSVDGVDVFYDIETRKDVVYDPKIHAKDGGREALGTFIRENTLPFDETKQAKTRGEQEMDAAWAELQKQAILQICRAPWMRSNYGAVSRSQRSYPRSKSEDAKDFNYGNICMENGYGNLVTYRVNSGATKMWYEVQYKNGQYEGRIAVDGPYKDGLLITNGEDFVKYGNSAMTMDAWREIIISCHFPEMLANNEDEIVQVNEKRLQALAACTLRPRLHVKLTGDEKTSVVVIDEF